MNNLIWQDGLLIDWLQKKVFDKWVRRFLAQSAYIVSERVLFDIVVRCYIDNMIWPSHYFSIFDFKSVANTLLHLLLIILVFFLTLHLLSLVSLGF